jgi:PD-(D/E)XK endonuclease
MERLINRRQQGDLGEASAIDWLTRLGATVSVPLGHSPDYDLVAELHGHLLRVQVKTSTCFGRTPQGGYRWHVAIRTNGGNQSWTGTTKRFDRSRVEALFVLVGDGRRWFIAADAVEARVAINLGGQKYAEFEIEQGGEIARLVYGDQRATLESGPPQGECPSGQREHAVNVPATPTQVRILPPPWTSPSSTDREPLQRGAGRPFSRTATIWGKRRLTIPRHIFEAADLRVGDRLRAHAERPGTMVFERVEAQASMFDTP